MLSSEKYTARIHAYRWLGTYAMDALLGSKTKDKIVPEFTINVDAPELADLLPPYNVNIYKAHAEKDQSPIPSEVPNRILDSFFVLIFSNLENFENIAFDISRKKTGHKKQKLFRSSLLDLIAFCFFRESYLGIAKKLFERANWKERSAQWEDIGITYPKKLAQYQLYRQIRNGISHAKDKDLPKRLKQLRLLTKTKDIKKFLVTAKKTSDRPTSIFQDKKPMVISPSDIPWSGSVSTFVSHSSQKKAKNANDAEIMPNDRITSNDFYILTTYCINCIKDLAEEIKNVLRIDI